MTTLNLECQAAVSPDCLRRRLPPKFPSMFVLGLTIFTGAFLLFLVEPLIARFILPWYGGSPEVWTTCMLFFQLLLLGGYAYAHASNRWLTTRRQVLFHLALLAIALLLLPIVPNARWMPVPGASPTGRILLLLVTFPPAFTQS